MNKINIYPTMSTNNIQEILNNNTDCLIYFNSGNYNLGALFFNNVSIYFDNVYIKGSDNIEDYKLLETRIEGETCLYYSALINISNCIDKTISGNVTIDGNGLKVWQSFWDSFKKDHSHTNKATPRARLMYISNSNKLKINGLKLINSQFWTLHLYKCENIEISNCLFNSPHTPIKAPSSDGIDIDVGNNIWIHHNTFDTNDDGVALKGGKGLNAYLDNNNGKVSNILIENNHYIFAHSVLTLGSEAIDCEDIIVRNNKVDFVNNLLWLKCRPDTSQIYKNIDVYNNAGKTIFYINIRPWTQFNTNDGLIPLTYITNINMHDNNITSNTFNGIVEDNNQYILKDINIRR